MIDYKGHHGKVIPLHGCMNQTIKNRSDKHEHKTIG